MMPMFVLVFGQTLSSKLIAYKKGSVTPEFFKTKKISLSLCQMISVPLMYCPYSFLFVT